MTEQTTTNTDAVIGTNGDDQITASTDVRAGDGNDSVQINPEYGNTQVITADGEAGNDTLTSESNAAVHLKGGEGEDTLTSTLGVGMHAPNAPSTILEGGSGNDLIRTVGTGDTIIFNRGDGQDRIEIDERGYNALNDTIQFGPGISPADLRLLEPSDGSEPVLQILQNGEPTGDSLVIVDTFMNELADCNLAFSDGSTLQLLELRSTLQGSDLADNLDVYTHQHEEVLAGDGDDTIYMMSAGPESFSADGEGGNDTISAYSHSNYQIKGGSGDDVIELMHGHIPGINDNTNTVIEGGTGNDLIKTEGSGNIIIFNRGDGQDRIEIDERGYNALNDTIQFGPGISATDLRLVEPYDGGDKVLQILQNGEPTGDSLVIVDVVMNELAECNIAFEDGTQMWLSDVALAPGGTAGDDYLIVNYDLRAGEGNDYVQLNTSPYSSDVITADGEGGNDTISAYSHSNYQIKGGSGDDVIELMHGHIPGINDNTNTVIEGGTGNDLIKTEGSGNTIIFNRGDGQDRIEIDERGYNALNDTIQFGPGISPADLRLLEPSDGSEPVLQILQNGEPTGDSLVIVDTFMNELADCNLAFSDGSTLQLLELRSTLQGSDLADNLDVYTHQHEEVLAGDGDDTIYMMSAGPESFSADGEGGNDTISAYSHSNYQIKGGSGDDVIELMHGHIPGINDNTNTVIEGGTGNDLIKTEGSGNTIIFNRGDGQDRIEIDERGYNALNDTIQFGPGISPADLRLLEPSDGSEPVLQILQNGEPTGDSLVIVDTFMNELADCNLAFSDGSTLQLLELRGTLQGSDLADNLDVYTHQHEEVLAGDGDDTIYMMSAGPESFSADGEGGNDTISAYSHSNYQIKGGSGDDVIELMHGHIPGINDNTNTVIEGGTGNDLIKTEGSGNTIIFNRGDGQDRIEIDERGYNALNDTIQFGPGISATDLRLVEPYDGGDKVLQILQNGEPTGDSLVIVDVVMNELAECNIAFEDGTQMWLSDVALAPGGTAGDDYLIVNYDLRAGEGNDYVQLNTSPYSSDVITADGEAGNDTLQGRSFTTAVLKGGDGDDQLLLQDGYLPHIADGAFTTLVGGAGDDLIQTSGSGATILFSRGDGNDRIEIGHYINSGKEDVIQFGDGITADDLRLVEFANGSEQVLQILQNGVPGGDSLTIVGEYGPAMCMLSFSDGSQLGFSELKTYYQGTDGDDYIHADANLHDTIKAAAGDDYIQVSIDPVNTDTFVVEGEAGNDTLQGRSFTTAVLKGGDGDDQLLLQDGYLPHISDGAFTTLVGGAGDDLIQTSGSGATILFSRGDGNDRIEIGQYDNPGKEDVIQFGDGITAADLRLVESANGGEQVLQILQNGEPSSDSLTIVGQFGPAMCTLSFSDGSQLGFSELKTYYQGTEGYDNITANAEQHETIKAAGGDDYIQVSIDPENTETFVVEGEAGNDSLHGRSFTAAVLKGGDGDDLIQLQDGYYPHITDAPFTTLEGGAGNDLIQTTGSGTTILFSRGDGNDRIEIGQYDNPGKEDVIQFGDGITAADLRLVESANGGEQVLQILQNGEPSSDSLTIVGQFGPAMCTLSFSDGSQLGFSELKTYYQGTEGYDNITANAEQHETIKAAGGDDYIQVSIDPESTETFVVEGEAGNDSLHGRSFTAAVLKGGDGDDLIQLQDGYYPHITDAPFTTLEGGTGNDLIQTTGSGSIITFNQGDGQDRLEIGSNGVSGKDDVIKFGQGISLSDLSFQAGQDLDITFNNSTDQITVADIMSVNPSVQVEFADGSTHNLFDLWVI